MAAYSLSSKAATDLEEIHEFTIDRFGLQQARTYLTDTLGELQLRQAQTLAYTLGELGCVQ